MECWVVSWDCLNVVWACGGMSRTHLPDRQLILNHFLAAVSDQQMTILFKLMSGLCRYQAFTELLFCLCIYHKTWQISAFKVCV